MIHQTPQQAINHLTVTSETYAIYKMKKSEYTDGTLRGIFKGSCGHIINTSYSLVPIARKDAIGVAVQIYKTLEYVKCGGCKTMGRVTTKKPIDHSYEEKDGMIKMYFKCSCGCLKNTGFRTNLEVAEHVADIARKYPCREFKATGKCEGSKDV